MKPSSQNHQNLLRSTRQGVSAGARCCPSWVSHVASTSGSSAGQRFCRNTFWPGWGRVLRTLPLPRISATSTSKRLLSVMFLSRDQVAKMIVFKDCVPYHLMMYEMSLVRNSSELKMIQDKWSFLGQFYFLLCQTSMEATPKSVQ